MLRCIEVDPTFVASPASNRPVLPESVTDLVESIRRTGQLIPGIVSAFPDKPPGYWLCHDGNRRLLACRILGIRFRAIIHEGTVTEGKLALTRIAANNIREKMSDAQVAADLERIMQEEQCSQDDLAQVTGISSGEISRILSFPKKACPELVAAAQGRICRAVARLIGTAFANHDQQRAVLAVVLKDPEHPLKREAVEAVIRRMKGTQPRLAKPAKVSDGAVTICFPGDWVWKQVEEWAQRLLGAVRRGEKTDVPPAILLPSMLKAV